MKKEWKQETIGVRGGLKRTAFDETSEAIFLNSGYVYPNAEAAEAAFSGDIDRFVYSRFGNPSAAMLQDRLAQLEGAEACLVMGTGMAAMFASVACMLSQGDRIVASRALFGACYAVIDQILPRWGIEREFVDGTDMEQWEKALSKPTKMVFLESPSNPLLDLVDIKQVAELAHKAGALVVVDNVFATQTGQKPLELGADMVMYSLTKHHDGQGRVLGGALLGSEELIYGDLLKFYRQTGPMMSAYNAWLILKSLETMTIRVEKMVDNASKIAFVLENNNTVTNLRYPHHPAHPQYELAKRQMSHGGSLLSFGVKGGVKAAFTMLNNLQLIDISNNLGDARSLACHPATTTHSSLTDDERREQGIDENLIRLSVGLEHSDDLISDLQAALGRVSS